MNTLSHEEYVSRCAARYQSVGGLTADQAKAAAEACWQAEQEFPELTESPEDAADSDMSYWTNDE